MRAGRRDDPLDPDRSLLDQMLARGIRVAHACGGNARCSTCRIRITAGLDACAPRTDAERAMAARPVFPDDIRLS